MADLVQVTEDVLGVIFEEEVSHLWVLGDPLPRGRWHYGMDIG